MLQKPSTSVHQALRGKFRHFICMASPFKLQNQSSVEKLVLAKAKLGAKHDFEIWAFKVFFLWTRKAALRMASRCPDLKTIIGKNSQDIPHNP